MSRQGARKEKRAGAGGGARRGRAVSPRDPMDDLRRRIDAIDRKMVALLNQRAACAIDLGRIKKDRGLPIYQPAREEEVLCNVRAGNGGPLENAALQRLFERIIDESRSIERTSTTPKGPARSSPGPGSGAVDRNETD